MTSSRLWRVSRGLSGPRAVFGADRTPFVVRVDARDVLSCFRASCCLASSRSPHCTCSAYHTCCPVARRPRHRRCFAARIRDRLLPACVAPHSRPALLAHSPVSRRRSARSIALARFLTSRCAVSRCRCFLSALCPTLPLISACFPARIRRLRLGPLSLAALHEVLKARLRRSFPRRTLVRVEHVAGGNPFFALRSPARYRRRAARLADRSAAGQPPPPRGSANLEASGGVAQDLDRCCGITSPHRGARADAVGTTVPRSLLALERAASAGIVRLDGPYNPVFASALRGSGLFLGAAGRSAPHARAAGAARARVGGACTPRALAAESTDEAAATMLDEAALHARRRGAPETAAALAEQACLLTPTGRPAQLLRRTIQSAEYQFHAGEPQRARQMLEQVLRAAPAGQGARGSSTPARRDPL